MENKEKTEKYKYVDERAEIAKALFNQLSEYNLSVDNLDRVMMYLENYIKSQSKVILKKFS